MKTLCSAISYAFLFEVQSISNKTVIFKPEKTWTYLRPKEKPLYESKSKRSPSGKLHEETVTVVIKHDPSLHIHNYPNFSLLLKLSTDQGTVIIGTTDFPVQFETSSDHIFDTITFTRKSIS